MSFIEVLINNMPSFLAALVLTLQLAVCALIIATIIGTITGIFTVSVHKTLQVISQAKSSLKNEASETVKKGNRVEQTAEGGERALVVPSNLDDRQILFLTKKMMKPVTLHQKMPSRHARRNDIFLI